MLNKLHIILKRIVFSNFFVRSLGSKFLFKFFFKKDTVIFLFHEVTNNPSEFHTKYSLNVCPELFEDQIKIIQRQFNVISPETLLEGNYNTPAAVITFDDGSKGNFTYAYPILEKLNCPSVMFLNMGPINGLIFWSGLITYLCDCDSEFMEKVIRKSKKKIQEPYFLYLQPRDILDYLEKHKELIFRKAREYYGDFMNPNDLKIMSNSELLKFGNHMYQHYNCANSTVAEITANFNANQKELNNFKNTTKLFSYPFGQKGTCYNQITNDLIFNLGAEAIFAAHSENFLNNGKFYYRFPLSEKVKSAGRMRLLLLIRKIIITFSIQDLVAKILSRMNKN